MEFFRAGQMLPGSPAAIAVGGPADPKSFTIGDQHSDGAAIIGFRNSAGNEAVHNCLDAAVALANLRADSTITPRKVANLIVNLFPSAQVAHLPEFVDALEKYSAAKSASSLGGVAVTAGEYLGIGLLLLPAVNINVPKVEVPAAIKNILGMFGL